ncbi:DUF3421 domain containing protein, partial [Asbolus verrucosus]
YYWRDFYGEIPDDAVPGGLDRNHKITYIAQVYFANHGILTTRLYQGEKSVTASRDGIHTSDVFIKVLCSHQLQKFSWVPATASRLHTELIGRHLVVGGTENGKILNIGRVTYQGEVIVGKVCGYNIGDAQMFFPYQNKEISVSSYEVLVYDDIPGGLDRKQKPTYIAQVHIPGYGIQIGRLYQGKDSITVSAAGIHTSDVFIQVLCSNKPQKLSWHPATASRLHTDFIGKHLVMGGTESGKALNIGRVSYQGEVIVGKVCGYIIENAEMFFPYQNAEVTVPSYETTIGETTVELFLMMPFLGGMIVMEIQFILGRFTIPNMNYYQKIAQTTAYSLVLNSSQHVKILCSPNKEAFEWISIHSKDLHKYASHNLIPGGSEVGENLYIGRISRDNGTLVGKVFRHGRVSGNGLWYPYNNRPVGTLTYEILSYNCENVMKTY